MGTSRARPGVGALLACLGAVLLSAFTGTASPAAAAVPTCRLGAYLSDLYRLDTAQQTVNADIWFWSVCPQAGLEPIRRFEYINASSTRQSARVGVRRGGRYWTYVKITGTYREQFDLGDYPFDRHTLNFAVEDTRDVSEFIYTPDLVDSTYNHAIRLRGFVIDSFRVVVRNHHYPTTFGDPEVRPGARSAYSRFVIRVTVTRTDVSGFVRETWPVYIAFVTSLATFLIWFEDETAVLGARLGILGAALFTIVVNLRAVNQSLGISSGMTLVDQIHLFTLVYVLVGVAATTYSWRMSVHPGGKLRALRVNRLVGLAATLAYLATTVLAVVLALNG